MKKYGGKSKIAARLSLQEKTMQSLLDQISLLETRVSKMADELNKFSVDLEEPVTDTHYSSNIILFPGTPCRKPYKPHLLIPLLAEPGRPLPSGTPDFRPVLQRDGLILLAWDKRDTERGELYSAYWVTSTGISRYYASKPLPRHEFSFACPDHKSYAAEDGIEFYGQTAPSYIIHVAPELMMSNPRHGELRTAHVNALKLQGAKVDFDYKYSLRTDKNRNPPGRKNGEYPCHQASL